jgi:hypothetical protein
VTDVALRSREAESSGSVGGDPFRGFRDGLHVFDSREADGDVVRHGECVGDRRLQPRISSSAAIPRASRDVRRVPAWVISFVSAWRLTCSALLSGILEHPLPAGPDDLVSVDSGDGPRLDSSQ